MNKIPPCPVCNEEFDNIFDATDHLLEENEEEFDPKLILPNGYSLMIGSLLRCIYGIADNSDEVKKICQTTYATLYAAETNPGAMKDIIQDIVVDQNMANIDEELKNLINDTESGE
jgi:hypothetical protein